MLVQAENQAYRVHLETVIDHLPTAVIAIDEETRVVLANQKAMFFARKTEKELIGTTCGKAFRCIHAVTNEAGCGHSPECECCTMLEVVTKTLADHRNRLQIETIMEFEELGKRYLSISTIHIRQERIVLLAVDDITVMRELERNRLEKEKLRTALETSGAFCHEMNQPLQALSGYIDLMLMEMDVDDPRREYMTISREQIARMGRITRKIMNLRSYHTRPYLNGEQILDIIRSSGEDEDAPIT